MLRDLKVGTKIIVGFIVVSLTPLVVVGYLSFANARDILERAAITELEAVAILKANAIEAFLTELRFDLKTVQDDFNVKTNLPIVTRFFNDRSNPQYISAQQALDSQLTTLKAVKGFTDIKLASQEGKIVYSVNGLSQSPESEDSFSRLDEVSLTEAQKRIYFSDIFRSASYELAMFGAAPIHDSSGTFIGLIIFEFNMERIYEIIQDTTGLGATGEVLLGRNEGEYALLINPLRHDPNAALTRKAVFGERDAFAMQEATQGRNGFGLSVDYRAQSVIAVWRYIPSLNWGMVAKIDTSEAFAPVFALRDRVLFIGLVALFIILALAYYISRYISRPVEELEKEKNKVDAILHAIGDGVFVVDRDYKIVMFNDAAAAISGFTSQDALGKRYDKILRFVNEKDGKSDDEFIRRVMTTGTIKEMPRYTTLIRKDGKKIPVADSAAPVKDKHGRVSGCVVVFQDFTKEREIDRAKSEFVSLASHQLRNPLTYINWLIQAILDGDTGKLNKEQEEYFEKIYRSIKLMVNLVDQFLDVSRIELGTFVAKSKPTSIMEITESVFDELSAQIQEKKLNIEKNYSKNVPVVNIDPKIARIVLQNLLSNSVKYTPHDGTIITEIYLKEDPERREQNKHIVIKVSDTGCGIPKYQHSKVFTKLFRADNVIKKEEDGSGIGLYITKTLIERIGGRIWFESEEGEGTTFYVELPIKAVVPME